MRPPGSPQDLERRRHRAIKLLKEGHPPVEVARMVGCDRRSVRRWNAAFRKGGGEAIKARPSPGRPPRLDEKDKRRLEEALLKGAKAAGFPTDLWTCPRVAQLIFDRFGLRYHVDHIGRLLHALGWSPQKPQRRAVERDEDEIRRWVKEEWPRVKKRCAAEGRPGVHQRIRLLHGALCPAHLGAQRVDALFVSMHPLAPEGVGDRRLVHC